MSTDEGVVRAARDVRVLTLAGHLTREALERALAGVGDVPFGVDLIVDTSAMTDYEGRARQRFVEWNTENRSRIRRLAIVTSNPLWMMVIRAMSLASGREMKPFTTRDDARAWMRDAG